MSNKYYITSIGYNVLNEELDQTLCQYETKIEWAQPSFQRCWTEMLFDTELDALNQLRSMYTDRTLTVLEDTGKVVSTYGHESGITTMRIRKEVSNE